MHTENVLTQACILYIEQLLLKILLFGICVLCYIMPMWVFFHDHIPLLPVSRWISWDSDDCWVRWLQQATSSNFSLYTSIEWASPPLQLPTYTMSSSYMTSKPFAASGFWILGPPLLARPSDPVSLTCWSKPPREVQPFQPGISFYPLSLLECRNVGSNEFNPGNQRSTGPSAWT